MVMTLCDRWHKLPDEVLAMDASSMYLIDVAARGGYFDRNGEGSG